MNRKQEAAPPADRFDHLLGAARRTAISEPHGRAAADYVMELPRADLQVRFSYREGYVTMRYGAESERTEPVAWWLTETASAIRDARRTGSGLLHINAMGGIQTAESTLTPLAAWLDKLTDPRTRPQHNAS